MSIGNVPGTADLPGLRRVHRIMASPAPVVLPDVRGTQDAELRAAETLAEAPRSGGFEEIYEISGAFPDGYWLRHPLAVRVTIEGPQYVAEQRDLNVHAFGPSLLEAIYSLRDELLAHAIDLEAMGARLAPRLQRQRDLLRQWLLRGCLA